MRSFSTREVARITGFTTRQLGYWDHQQMVGPTARQTSGRGTPRRYSEEDLVRLCFIRELKRKGWSTQRIHKALKHLHEVMDDPNPMRHVLLDHNENLVLVLCKTKSGARTLVDTLSPGGQLVMDIAVEQLMEEVAQLQLTLE